MGGEEREKEWALLMRAGIAGDAEFYRRLLRQLTPVLRAAARRGLAPAGMADTDAEDVVQETLLAIHLKRQSWDEDAPFGPWLRAIARHKMIDALRRRGRRVNLPLDDFSEGMADGKAEPDMLAADARPASRISAAGATYDRAGDCHRWRVDRRSGGAFFDDQRSRPGGVASGAGGARPEIQNGGAVKTDDLIRALAADCVTRPMSLRRAFVVAMIPGAAIAFCLYLTILGPRPHFLGLLAEPQIPVQGLPHISARVAFRRIGYAYWQAGH